MKLVVLIGAPAVGKMTVGQELQRLSGLKLFHNHVAIEAVQPFFSYGTPEGRRLVAAVRDAFFDAFLQSDGPGYIFTFVWAFGEPGEKEYIDAITDRFASAGFDIHLVELTASWEERQRRNVTPNRLACKPSKRDLDWSVRHLAESNARHRFVSEDGEIAGEDVLRLDTTALSAEQTARRIWDHVRGETA